MNIIVAGKNNIAIKIAEYIAINFPSYNLHSVLNNNDVGENGFQNSYKKFCREKNINIIDLDTAYKLSNSIFLSLEFDKIVDPNKFNHERIYNIHFSMLPKYKGMYTSAWPIINNEDKTGVTFHKIDHGIDTGDIIFQTEFNIDLNETAKSLYAKYIEAGSKLILDNIVDILNDNFESTPQKQIKSSYYSKNSIDYLNLSIDLKKSAIEIKKQLDAFTFREYQLPIISDQKIFGCQISSKKSKERPGKIINENENSLILSTIDHDLYLYKDNFFEFLDACKDGNMEYVNKNTNPYLINEKNKLGWSPIIVAAFNGHLEIIKKLLSQGANINDKNYKGTTVFMYAKNYALNNNDVEFLDELVKFGADVYSKDLDGKNVFDYVDATNNKASRIIMEKFK